MYFSLAGNCCHFNGRQKHRRRQRTEWTRAQTMNHEYDNNGTGNEDRTRNNSTHLHYDAGNSFAHFFNQERGRRVTFVHELLCSILTQLRLVLGCHGAVCCLLSYASLFGGTTYSSTDHIKKTTTMMMTDGQTMMMNDGRCRSIKKTTTMRGWLWWRQWCGACGNCFVLLRAIFSFARRGRLLNEEFFFFSCAVPSRLSFISTMVWQEESGWSH